MKSFIYTFIFCIFFIAIGFGIGYQFRCDGCISPAELKGCEISAFSVNDQLIDCEITMVNYLKQINFLKQKGEN
jgi:hypothetical protein